jgi:hypothetical protein
MKQPVVIAGLSPHPPIVVPAVGRGEERQASATSEGLRRLGKALAGSGADTLVVITPHGPVFSDACRFRGNPSLRGQPLCLWRSRRQVCSLRTTRSSWRRSSGQAGAETDLPLAVLDDRKMEMYGVGKELDSRRVVVTLHFIVEQGFLGTARSRKHRVPVPSTTCIGLEPSSKGQLSISAGA